MSALSGPAGRTLTQRQSAEETDVVFVSIVAVAWPVGSVVSRCSGTASPPVTTRSSDATGVSSKNLAPAVIETGVPVMTASGFAVTSSRYGGFRMTATSIQRESTTLPSTTASTSYEATGRFTTGSDAMNAPSAPGCTLTEAAAVTSALSLARVDKSRTSTVPGTLPPSRPRR